MTETAKTATGKNAKKTGKKGVAKKSYKKPDRKDIQKIIEMTKEKVLTAKTLESTFNYSPSMSQKIVKYFRNAQFRPINEGETPLLPDNYMFPKNYKDLITAVMYDNGYI